MSTEMNFIKHKWLLSEFYQFRKTDPDYLKRLQNMSEWKKNNKDKVLASQKKYVENNKDKVMEWIRKWQKNNKEKFLNSVRKWQKENKDKVNKYHRERNRAIAEIKKLNQ